MFYSKKKRRVIYRLAAVWRLGKDLEKMETHPNPTAGILLLPRAKVRPRDMFDKVGESLIEKDEEALVEVSC